MVDRAVANDRAQQFVPDTGAGAGGTVPGTLAWELQYTGHRQ